MKALKVFATSQASEVLQLMTLNNKQSVLTVSVRECRGAALHGSPKGSEQGRALAET